jgi:hypothetical protein
MQDLAARERVSAPRGGRAKRAVHAIRFQKARVQQDSLHSAHTAEFDVARSAHAWHLERA